MNNYPHISKTARETRKKVTDILPPEAEQELPVSPMRKIPAISKPEASEAAPQTEPQPPRLRALKQTAPEPEKEAKDWPTEIELPVRTWEPEGIRRRRRLMYLAAFGSMAIVILGFILPLAAFPKFAITITPKVETLELTPLTLEASSAIAAPDVPNRRIPATRLSIESEVSQDQKATGQKHMSERAGGIITIFNAYSSLPQTLVSGTRFRTAGGQVFRIAKSIVIPGAKIEEGKIVPQSLTTQVIAAEAGEAYNIGPTDFRIPGFLGSPKYEGFYAKSTEPMQGGFEGQATVATADDIRKAEEELSSRLVKKLEEELMTKIPPDQDLLAINGARQTTLTNIDKPSPGSRGESFGLSARGRGDLMLIRNSHLFEIIKAEAMPQEGLAELGRSQPKLALSATNFDSETSRMQVKIEGSINFFRKTPAEEILNILKSSTPSKAEAYLRGREEIASFKIKKFPAWLWFIPRREGGLKVVVEEPQG